MTDDKRYGPADEGAAEGGESTAPDLAHIARSGDAAKGDDERDPGDQVPDVLESAAELGLGAVIAPFTGGETVNIVGSVASMLEAGYDRLTHLGEHETPPEEAAAEPADDGPE